MTHEKPQANDYIAPSINSIAHKISQSNEDNESHWEKQISNNNHHWF